MWIESKGHTFQGRRTNNEDALVVEEGLGLFAVADGMGGREGGEVASRLAVEAITALVAGHAEAEINGPTAIGDPHETLEEGLVSSAIGQANQSIAAKRVGSLSQMGTTMALLLLRDGMAVIGHVGDSRVYRLRNGQLTQLTRDHSLYDELLAAGAQLPPRDQFPYSNVITRVLGDVESSEPDLRREPVLDGDVFLLCSDGLTESMTPARLAFVLSHYSASEAVPRLVREAYLRGANDNITAVVVDVKQARAAQPAAEPARMAV